MGPESKFLAMPLQKGQQRPDRLRRFESAHHDSRLLIPSRRFTCERCRRVYFDALQASVARCWCV